MVCGKPITTAIDGTRERLIVISSGRFHCSLVGYARLPFSCPDILRLDKSSARHHVLVPRGPAAAWFPVDEATCVCISLIGNQPLCSRRATIDHDV